jgi:hypothetical protein
MESKKGDLLEVDSRIMVTWSRAFGGWATGEMFIKEYKISGQG